LGIFWLGRATIGFVMNWISNDVWHVLVVLVATSCATTGGIKIDETKVLGYHFELEDQKKMQQPYVAEFAKGDKKLLYVLSKHVSEKEFPRIIEHPTNVTIRKLFERFRPQVVIVEGIPPEDEKTPQKLRDHIAKCKNQEFKGCGESFYAMDQAIESSARYITGEPTEEEIREHLARSGFSQQDILGFYMVRQIPQMKRRNTFSKESFPRECERFLEHYRKRIGMREKFDCGDFKAWYGKNMHKPKNYLDIENNDPAPHGGTDATYVQRISHQVGLARDRVIVKKIENMLNLYDRVLVVYGGSHYLLQEHALKDSLGEPIFYKEVGK
jgi:hypothetical protein